VQQHQSAVCTATSIRCMYSNAMNNVIISVFSNFGDQICGVRINMIVICDYTII
jgi:hypothetical protein